VPPHGLSFGDVNVAVNILESSGKTKKKLLAFIECQQRDIACSIMPTISPSMVSGRCSFKILDVGRAKISTDTTIAVQCSA